MQPSRLVNYRRVIWFSGLAFILALLPFAFAARDSNLVSTETRDGRLAVFDDVWQTVRDRYYDANFHGVDWVAQRLALRAQAGDARNTRELYAVLRHLLAPLLDAHTRVYAPDEKFDWEHPRFVGIGVSLREVEGQATVVAVDPGSAAARAGVRPGDVIEKIDGELVPSLLERKLREQLGSSTLRAARIRAVTSLLTGEPNTNVQVGWRAIDNREHSASFRREWHERNFVVQISNRRGDYPVVAVDAFTWSVTHDLARTLQGNISRARGIVLDLRNNGGGDAEAMAGTASYFLPAATDLGEFTNRSGGVALSLETQTRPLLTVDRLKQVDLPVVILIGERTSSAAEILVAAMQDAKRAVVIGTETCGCVLAVRTRHALPDGGELDVSELDYRTARRVRLEGRGITPDESVSLRREDLYAGRDRAVELALARLKGLSLANRRDR